MTKPKNKLNSPPKATRCVVCNDIAIPRAKYQAGNEVYYKCSQCFEKDKSLSDFQECEVYSRIVGYLRPVKQWNVGKQEEYKKRKTFKSHT